MAFDAKGLRRKEHRGGVGTGDGSITSDWSYDTNDTAAVVETAAYFNSVAGQLSKGDTIDAVMVRAGTPIRKHYHVTVNTGTAVTIALQTVTAG